jgi:hypothetical protein
MTMSRKGSKKKSHQNEVYKREGRRMKNKVARIKKTLKRQPNNEELKTRLKKIA